MLKNSEGNRDDVWNFCRGKEAEIALFLIARDKNLKSSEKSSKKTSRLLSEIGRSQATNLA